MKKNFQDEKGITLVELLAVLVIGGIVMILIMGIFSNGQKQYSSQTAKAEQLNDLRYAAKVITKEIRKADKVKSKDNVLELGSVSPIIFKESNEKVLKNGVPLISNISLFSISPVTPAIPATPTTQAIPSKRKLIINISTEKKGIKQSIETEIYIRDGVIIDE